ncbi:PD-(D/E)XK nuclease family protein [Halarchaeum sp. CBA1220]|uniref:PD-(D/E)XK nuclease family protein n=1 Tax=Halarchaeum sp. CBA1220 TaxID=1853682 RepID=UPI000F3A84FB|nr:PD-(D/E)XK nuclease family protein [Halarchaeum sp. CBA1220]QLC34362.1 PD-(D/E)XK nuclease family protein [Halarchaeum sp. CBA1220]
MSEDVPELDPGVLEAFIEEYLQLDRKVQQPEGLYSILSGPREKQYQDSLRYFLDPQRPHGFDETLLEAFLECLNVHHHNLPGQHVELETEVQIADAGSDGRIDLMICGGSALSDHPQWGVFLELKVGATEGQNQTPTYAEADRWNFSWFDSDEVIVDRLTDTDYAYLKRDSADDATADSFRSVAWKDLVDEFDRQLESSLFDYPHRSVVQFTDFIQSLKETEHMDSPFDESQLSERLDLYFEYSDLIEQVEKANSQFESDFEDLSKYLRSNWEARLRDSYDFEASGWLVSPSSNPKWQGLLPAYWNQDPLNSDSTIRLYFRHSPTTDSLRNRTLSFRLRLPPQRHVHTTPQSGGRSFNDVFTSLASTEYADQFGDALAAVDVDETRLGSASELCSKEYPLDPQNLAGSYFAQLDAAVGEFCVDNPELLTVLNEVFEQTYQTVFETEPAGEFPGQLQPKG